MPMQKLQPFRLKKPNIFEQNTALEEQKSKQKKEFNLPLAVLLALVLIVLLVGAIFMYLY